MRHRKTYMYVNFCKLGLVDQSKPCTLVYLQKNGKLHKFATTNSNIGKNHYFRYAPSYNVYVYQFSANLG